MFLNRLFGFVVLACMTISTAFAAESAPLADAIEHRKFDLAQNLISQKADVDQAQPDGMTGLHWAIQHDQYDLAKQLIEAGAKTTAANRFGVMPLAIACQNGNERIIALLLDHDVDANAALPGGETPLMSAARTGRLKPVELLIAKGANVNATEHKGQTALMWAVNEGNLEVVDALITAGADVRVQLKSGFTPLLFAVRQGHADVTMRLLEAGCDVNDMVQTQQSIRFGNGRLRINPLLMAVENGHFELAEYLLKQGADPNARPAGYTALHCMTWVRKPIRGDGDPSPTGSGRYTSLDMVRILKDAGADLNAKMTNGKTELGRFTYAGSTPFLLAAQASDLQLMKLLVDLGADINIPNADGTTVLMAAAGVGALGDGDESAGTEEETLAVINYLLDLGADVNAVDQNGETAVHGAAYQSLPEVVRLLVKRGADPNVWNRENRAGWTPLKIAIGYRPGNFRPAPQTIDAIKEAMLATNAKFPDAASLQFHARSWSAQRNEDYSWVIKDIEYARVADHPLLLDLHFPRRVTSSSLIVWVHGGAWRSGSKDDMPLKALVDAGYTVASVDYRLSPQAKFPAQVHDIKAAIRYLRHLAHTYGYRSDQIAIAGSSAGGHLAALVGTTNGNKELEGIVGKYLDQSSSVQAIVDLFGPTNLSTILDQSAPKGLEVRVPALQLLLGLQPKENTQLAELASPTAHVDAMDPPLLIIHGDQDPQVPLAQSQELFDQYKKANLSVELEVIPGAVHGGDEFYDKSRLDLICKFLSNSLQTR